MAPTRLVLEGVRERPAAKRERVFELADRAGIAHELGDGIMTLVERHTGGVLLAALHGLDLSHGLYGALLEVVGAEEA